MAGIGFVLRKLYRQDNLSGLARAMLHSGFAAAGPWIFTVLALGAIAILGEDSIGIKPLFFFRTILIYNFAFSLMLSGPILMVTMRYLSDSIYRRDVSNAPGMLFGSLVILWCIEIPVTCLFYFGYARLGYAVAISATINFLMLSAVWLISVFISALRNYRLVTYAFLTGMLVAVAACMTLGKTYGVIGMLNGFTAGLSVIAGLLLGSVLMEYPYPIKKPFAFLVYFKRFPELALSGFIYNMAIWIDKWIMWFAPEATKLGNGLVIYPNYDSTMFIAYLTTIPAMALFLFHTETLFFEQYMRFYRDIDEKQSLGRIEQDHQTIVRSIFGNAANFFLLQGTIAFIGVLIAPQIIHYIHGNYLQIGMLRFGILGALFQVLTLFLLVLFSYFDNRMANIQIQVIFLSTNALFTIASLLAGFRYYGFGYFLACIVTFVVAALMARRYIKQLPYHTFVTTNASIF